MCGQRCYIPNARSTSAGADLQVEGFSRHGTLGGIISYGDRFYGLTAAHIFEPDYSTPLLPINPTVTFYDSDGDEEEVYSYQFSNRETSISHVDGSLSSSRTLQGIGNNPTTIPIPAGVEIAANDQAKSNKNYDWALLKVEDLRSYVFNGVSLDSAVHFVTQLQDVPPQGKVFIPTRRGVLEGFGGGVTAHITSTEILRAARWSIQLKRGHNFGNNPPGIFYMEFQLIL